jgi:hypothetical protein
MSQPVEYPIKVWLLPMGGPLNGASKVKSVPPKTVLRDLSKGGALFAEGWTTCTCCGQPRPTGVCGLFAGARQGKPVSIRTVHNLEWLGFIEEYGNEYRLTELGKSASGRRGSLDQIAAMLGSSK